VLSRCGECQPQPPDKGGANAKSAESPQPNHVTPASWNDKTICWSTVLTPIATKSGYSVVCGKNSCPVGRIADHNRGCAVELLQQHHSDELMRPGGGAKRDP